MDYIPESPESKRFKILMEKLSDILQELENNRSDLVAACLTQAYYAGRRNEPTEEELIKQFRKIFDLLNPSESE